MSRLLDACEVLCNAGDETKAEGAVAGGGVTKRTRWFLDTEFNEDGRTIDLISIALVCEDGRYYYAHSDGYNPSACNDWVKANVLPHVADLAPVSRSMIASDVRRLVLHNGQRPEFWAYFADYDWVALCQLYGPMVELPDGFPFYCRDLKQLMDELGVQKDQLPAQTNEHDALADARWVRDAFNALRARVTGAP